MTGHTSLFRSGCSVRPGSARGPPTARGGHEDDRGQNFTVTSPTSAPALRTPHLRGRHHPPEQHPQATRHQPLTRSVMHSSMSDHAIRSDVSEATSRRRSNRFPSAQHGTNSMLLSDHVACSAYQYLGPQAVVFAGSQSPLSSGGQALRAGSGIRAARSAQASPPSSSANRLSRTFPAGKSRAGTHPARSPFGRTASRPRVHLPHTSSSVGDCPGNSARPTARALSTLIRVTPMNRSSAHASATRCPPVVVSAGEAGGVAR